MTSCRTRGNRKWWPLATQAPKLKDCQPSRDPISDESGISLALRPSTIMGNAPQVTQETDCPGHLSCKVKFPGNDSVLCFSVTAKGPHGRQRWPLLNLEINSTLPKQGVRVRTFWQPVPQCHWMCGPSWWHPCLFEPYFTEEITSVRHPGHWAGPHTRHRGMTSLNGYFHRFYFGFFPRLKHLIK